ncbi:hypothetical protein BB560_004267 [Smittium megazygosporum]|uniref:Cystathionine gamma-synthase n=1 Tax=Smittium megazygosporum TaxID=133381 RepID=A0A2T9Z9N9_9FUNG|nr:hypothetical protein BB560_004267 [Smittium megazygosporum]
MNPIPFGDPVPEHSPFAISVSFPKWQDNIDYEKGEPRAIQGMKSGYPRFFISKLITELSGKIRAQISKENEQIMLFPTPKASERCKAFILECISKQNSSLAPLVRVTQFTITPINNSESQLPQTIEANLMQPVTLHITVFDEPLFQYAKQYWQHTGDGITSRQAEYCLRLLRLNNSISSSNSIENPILPKFQSLNVQTSPKIDRKTPPYYKKPNQKSTLPQPHTAPITTTTKYDVVQDESDRFIEERFGRNLNSNMADLSKSILKKRISGLIKESDMMKIDRDSKVKNAFVDRKIPNLSDSDVFLTSTGMGKFGPGAHFFGLGEGSDYDELENMLSSNPDSIAALFTETPNNPLLKTPDLHRLRNLADKYGFILVVDDTIGNFVNLDTLPLADVVVSSLSKLFSGDNDILWWEDAIFLERNSRSFIERNKIINSNAELVFDILSSNKYVESVYYPKNVCADNYRKLKRNSPDSGFGGLLSVVFKSENIAKCFYDNLECSKGPSLGTNFTLASPYTILAHFHELDWAQKYGVSPYLIRISVGLENPDSLQSTFEKALQKLEDIDI